MNEMGQNPPEEPTPQEEPILLCPTVAGILDKEVNPFDVAQNASYLPPDFSDQINRFKEIVIDHAVVCEFCRRRILNSKQSFNKLKTELQERINE